MTRTMPASFHVDAGPFSFDVQLDDSGIRLQRGTLVGTQTETIPWDMVTGATLVPPSPGDFDDKDERQIAQFLGTEAAQKMHQLKGHVGQICIAYRNQRDSLDQTELPAPLTDPAFLREFQTRLGPRWLGETKSRDQVDKKLHTNPGFFKTIFILVALIGIVAVVAVVGLFGLLGPAFNFLSIQKMLLDLQDGNYTSLAYRAATYVALFFIGYFLHRVIRGKLDAMKRGRRPRIPFPR